MTTLTDTYSQVELDPHAHAPRPAGQRAAAASSAPAEPSALGVFDVLFFGLVAAAAALVLLLIPLASWAQHPDAWEWGRRLMSVERGLIGTGLLAAGAIAVAMTLAAGVRSPRLVRGGLIFGLLAGVGYLVVLGIDYDAKYYRGLTPGDSFRPSMKYVARRFRVTLPVAAVAPQPAASIAAASRQIDPINGRRLFLGTCASCHGVNGEGMPGQGKPMPNSEFIASCDDQQLLKFVIAGRQPWDPLNTTKVAMPGRGGNPMLKDDDLRDIIAHVRALQQHAKAVPAPPPAGRTASSAASEPSVAPPDAFELELLASRWVVSPSPSGPSGLNPDYLAALTRPAWRPPPDAVAFFSSYFMATGLAAVQVLAAIAVAGWLLIRAWRGAPPARTPRQAATGLWLWAAAYAALLWPVYYGPV